MIALLTILIAPLLHAEGWTYPTAVQCLQSLHAEIQPAESMIAFDRNKVGVMPGSQTSGSGFFIILPKVAFFVAAAEMVKSGDGSTGESKMTLAFPNNESTPIKFFSKDGRQIGSITFATANEFDRQVLATAVPEKATEGALGLAISTALRAASPQVKTNPARFGKALDVCIKTGLDFRLIGTSGVEATFQAEAQRLKDKMRPGIFTKEYWLPKKEGAG